VASGVLPPGDFQKPLASIAATRSVARIGSFDAAMTVAAASRALTRLGLTGLGALAGFSALGGFGALGFFPPLVVVGSVASAAGGADGDSAVDFPECPSVPVKSVGRAGPGMRCYSWCRLLVQPGEVPSRPLAAPTLEVQP